MTDDIVLRWVEAPPPPAVRPELEALVARVASADAVTLVGDPGSGRRTVALAAAARGGVPAYVVPAMPWRIPGALFEIARRLGIALPPELSPMTIVTTARGAMSKSSGLLIADARVRAEPEMIGALAGIPGWRLIVLAPRGTSGLPGAGDTVELPPPPAVPGTPAGTAAVLEAAAYFDPWEGAPRDRLAEVAQSAGGVEELIAAGLLRPAGEAARVLPTLHAFQARSAPAGQPAAERFVRTMAAWCAGASHSELTVDRANVMNALAIWPDVAPVGLVEQFARALPALLDDAMCHDAAKMVIGAAQQGGEVARAFADDARHRMGWS